MAFARRSGQRFTANVWPGFVDAMTALLLVLMFVLSIFMIVQFVLSETLNDRERELLDLNDQINGLARALGLEQQRAAALENDVAFLTDEGDRQALLIATLTEQRDDLTSRVASFEEQVASLIADRDRLSGALSDAEGSRDALAAQLETTQGELTRIIDEREALQLALAAAREEIDAQTEAARLAAARADAVEALVAELQAEAETREASLAQTLAALQQSETDTAALSQQVTDLTANLDQAEAARLAELAAAEALRARLAEADQALSEEEAARLAEAAAAEALRERLENSDAELTAMTLALEEKRREAEETLTLLAAAQAAQDDLDTRLTDALLNLQASETRFQNSQSELQASRDAAADLDRRLAQALAALDATGQDADGLASRVAELEAELAAQVAARSGAEADAAAIRAELETRLAEALAAQQARDVTEEELRQALTAALAERAAAQAERDAATDEAQSALSERERIDLLLAQARGELAAVEEDRIAAQREAALLNEQILQLRTQLNSLQGLLDEAANRDADAQVQIDALGSQLNAALAQVAANERAERRRLEEEAKQLERFRSEFFGQLREVLGERDGVEIVGDRFVFSSEVLFDVGDVTLQQEGRRQITQVATVILDVADQIPSDIDWILRVDGHTDNIPLGGTGKYSNNWELSQGRALSVVQYMIDELGVPPFRLAATGFGEYQPVDTDDTPEARQRNRRIEFKLTER